MRSNSPVPKHRRVNKILKRAKGFKLGRKRLRSAMETIVRAEHYATVHRREKKRTMRSLWILRINAAARANGMKYSTFVDGLKKSGVNLSTKTLSQIAFDDAAGFTKLVEKSRAAIA